MVLGKADYDEEALIKDTEKHGVIAEADLKDKVRYGTVLQTQRISSSSSILFQETWPIKTRTSRNRKTKNHTHNMREHREDRNTKHRNKLYSTLD